MNPSAGSGATSKFDERVRTWRDIPGWFQWRRHQEEAAAQFPDAQWFVEVGCYLGRSICSLGEVVREAGLDTRIVGVDTARGSGPEGRGENDAHGEAVDYGGGTFAGLLHRNVVDCGLAETIQLVISDSVAAADLFADGSVVVGAHRRAPRLRERRCGYQRVGTQGDTRGLVVRRRSSAPTGGPGWCGVSDACPMPAWGSMQWRWIKPG